MTRVQNFCLLFIAGIVIACCANAQVQNTYAVVVGISGYQNPSIPRLTYADKDATQFAEWLQSKAGGSVPSYRIDLFTNENATIANVYTALDRLKLQAHENDIIYFYFSGHGDIETRDTISKGYLLAWNSPATNYRNNAISVADINENANILTTINKAKVIIITDACHSGKMAGDFYKGRQLTAANLQLVLNNQVRLASCEANEEAAEGPGWGGGRGVFSYYLLRGLQGLATPENNGVIKLSSLETYMNTSFRSDENLILDKHRQNPVVDGSPLFPMAIIDTGTLNILKSPGRKNDEVIKSSPMGLQSLKTVGVQPIDYFFSIAKTAELDSLIDIKKYDNTPAADVPVKIVHDFILLIQSLQKQSDSLRVVDSVRNIMIGLIYKHLNNKEGRNRKKYTQQLDSISIQSGKDTELGNSIYVKLDGKNINTLATLEKQLQSNKYTVSRFNEKLVLLTHEKSQEMINAYLGGDLAELEKRQYYYAGNRQYRRFISILDLAVHVAPETNYLSRILKINRSYITGLVDRMEMAIHKKTDSLLTSAFYHQRQALSLEPYAAYIHNEIGNLYFSRRLYDSALYHFDYALILSPAWAVPWSNKIRLNLALNNTEKAKDAIRIADSLQPNLAYVNVNAGLVMESDSNLLAAESYYQSAIAQNNVHYLPFERLGFVYLQIGKYALADSFFMEAKKRKDAFAVNDMPFEFGIELGGGFMGREGEKNLESCNLSEDETVAVWQPLTALAKALLNAEKPEKNEEVITSLKESIAKTPDLMLAHHYLGLKYFTGKKPEAAENYLKEAIRRYLPADSFTVYIKSQMETLLRENIKKITGNAAISIRTDTSCLKSILIYYHYYGLEDHYMLGNIYEQQGRLDEALNQYKIIAAEENEKLMAQATYKGYNKTPEDESYYFNREEQIDVYETPVRQGGTLKAARLLEKQERYEDAEKVLLQQVQFNRKAGYARQEVMNKRHWGPGGPTPHNIFWLSANYDLEAETYNFYNRMLALYPRNADWYRKAGMFLYERLSLSYSMVSIAEQKAFYEYSREHAYPFKGSVEEPVEGFDEFGKHYEEVNMFDLPATNEEVFIEMKAYDPLKKSLSFLENAIKFSGDARPNAELTEAIANLEKWMGNNEAAINGFNNLVNLQPQNNKIRNRLIELLEFNKNLSAAAAQLDSLQKRTSLSNEQIIRLAYYKLLSRHAPDGLTLLKKYVPHTTEEKNLKTSLLIQHFVITGQLKNALRYIRDSLQTPEAPKDEFAEEPVAQIVAFDDSYYTEARILAMTNQDSKAFAMVKELLDSGYSYKNILMKDPAFAKLMKTKKWTKLLKGYSFPEPNEETDRYKKMNYSTVKYRIPGSNFNPMIWE